MTILKNDAQYGRIAVKEWTQIFKKVYHLSD